MVSPTPPLRLRWDLFCRVVDNHGDVGVCWRLARELGRRGHSVRLILDDASALAWMAPDGAPGVEVCSWPGPTTPGDVVVEAFGCDPPAEFVQAMAAATVAPVWINLEYLSAEPYVERSHGLPSPQRVGPCKWFFYPGFTARTGGLLREPGLIEQQRRFSRHAWLQSQGVAARPGERVISLFCYDNATLPALLQDLGREPTLLLLTPGHAQRQVQVQQLPHGVRCHALPWLSQHAYDRLLWSCDLNLVRGEDSLVRAIWAGVPFIWQAYPQHDGAHLAKLQALLANAQLPAAAAATWLAWNHDGQLPWPPMDLGDPWRQATLAWRTRLSQQTDLASQLLAFTVPRLAPNASC